MDIESVIKVSFLRDLKFLLDDYFDRGWDMADPHIKALIPDDIDEQYSAVKQTFDEAGKSMGRDEWESYLHQLPPSILKFRFIDARFKHHPEERGQ